MPTPIVSRILNSLTFPHLKVKIFLEGNLVQSLRILMSISESEEEFQTSTYMKAFAVFIDSVPNNILQAKFSALAQCTLIS